MFYLTLKQDGRGEGGGKGEEKEEGMRRNEGYQGVMCRRLTRLVQGREKRGEDVDI